MKTRADQIFDSFVEFHQTNPHIWKLFKQYTLQAIASGRQHYGSACIFERIRWHMQVETAGGDLKLNDHYTAYYARLFHAAYPEHDGFFRNRKLVSEEQLAHDHDQQVFVLPPPDGEEELMKKLKELL